MKILLVEDEKISRITLSDTLRKEGYSVTDCETGRAALIELENQTFDVVITDLRLPTMNGLDILKFAKEKNPNVVVIIITAFASVDTAVNALKLGAYDYLTKPFSPDKLLSMLKNIQRLFLVELENMKLRNEIEKYQKKILIGNSDIMQRLMLTIQTIAGTEHTVLIQGESGTGKEMVAKSIHLNSSRNKNDFIAVNCAALPETLLESELFGHEKGAFTGANRRHKGFIERAHKGTLFIDDIDDFPIKLQVKLLRVLQEREIQRIGGMETVSVDIRVICATKVNLLKLVQEGKFREDLYYRLNIIPLKVPPLRERKSDIPCLIEHFIEKYDPENSRSLFSTGQLEKMLEYDWPGNVRELENIVQRVLALPNNEEFVQFLWDHKNVEHGEINEEKIPKSFNEFILEKERELIDWALKKTNNNISDAARLLKLPRSTLRSKIDKLMLRFHQYQN